MAELAPYKLKPEWKQKWIEALVSDEFTQTRGCLKNDSGGHDALGVLCEIVLREKAEEVGAHWFKMKDRPIYTVIGVGDEEPSTNLEQDNIFLYMPYYIVKEVFDPVGAERLEARSGWLNQYVEAGKGRGMSIASLNDTGADFADIADVIERLL